jgi:hypothetical protein
LIRRAARKGAIERLGEVMMSTPRIFSLMVVAASVLASAQVAADEARTRALDTSIPASSMSAPSGSDGSSAKSSADDLSARIDQLEANRAAAGQQPKSPISLGVSGWVSQQVTITHQ